MSEPHITLRSLAPKYDKDQHASYVRHLEDAVKEKKNRNIALTGRYGSGKSSVLDEFERNHKQSTIRISINTLGPDEGDEDLTNRIQKELVKQLVYRLEPGQVRRSRFARPKPLTKRRAFYQALGSTSVGLSLLWLLGVRPASGWPGADAGTAARAGLSLLLFVLVLLAVWAVRWFVGDRIVSEVTTAGAGISLEDGPTTYFDSYLGEIVQFFETVEPGFVIFEDLDRFDDPQIFDSLYELNTLINASAHWRDKEQPLRFIYAIKDSLFEQLGQVPEPKSEGSDDEKAPRGDSAVPKPQLDLAAAAVRRANRTKFFELVVPIVPFISHRNARDHLVNALVSVGFSKDFVSRPLLDLIARHTTDMRLMINICNEFAVFTEQLLWTQNSAPGMTADHLFALVAYKNFHLADFEAISQRTSTLDTLEREHRAKVRSLIKGLQEKRNTEARTEEQREQRERTAADLGSRLSGSKQLFPAPNGWHYYSLEVEGESCSFEDTGTVEFWQHVARTKSFTLVRHSGTPVTPTEEQIGRVFPEIMDPTRWLDPDPAELAQRLRLYDRDIKTLRGADFAELARYERLSQGETGFDQRITEVLESELARDLVRRGFITRNYAEFSAVFYGSFVGVDVAFFYNHSVQPNEMYLDYEFTSEHAMSNLLEQVPDDFTSSVSVLNLQVASYILTERPTETAQLVEYLVTHDSDDVMTFLDAFLSDPDVPRVFLVEGLVKHPWPEIFKYLADHPGIPDEETRLTLFDVALLNTLPPDAYELGEHARGLLKTWYPQFAAVREAQPPDRTDRIFAILETAGVTVASLGDLSEPLRDRVVAEHMYEMNASNLRLALGIDVAPTLDEVRKKPSVWEFCKAHVAAYVALMRSGDPDAPIVQTEAVLIDVINEQHESWTEGQVRGVIDGSAASATIQAIHSVPQSVWPLLVDAERMSPSVANVDAYARALGIDSHLSGFLTSYGDQPLGLQNTDEIDTDARDRLAVQIMNAAAPLTPGQRVQLVWQLEPTLPIDVSGVTPTPEQFLAEALKQELLSDDLETFAHFAQGGWQAVSEAFEVSENVSGFLEPALVRDFVPEFLGSAVQELVPLQRIVVENLDNYVPNDDLSALREAGQFARTHKISLSVADVRRIARVTQAVDVVLPLLVREKGIAPEDLVDILASLGSPYDQLAGGPGVEFDQPSGPVNSKLFKRLEDAGRVDIVQKHASRGRTVRNLV